jgi:predicted HD phosphohydrolase
VEIKKLEPMPEKPSLVDFFKYRFAPATHVLQSATDAMKKGEKEEMILACLLHDVVLNLIKVDHGWWGAQLLEPYVSEKVSWGIRYHQALRFFPDPSVGYEYPEMYNRIFGKDYVPPRHVKQAYDYACNHKWYMEARMITVHDLYAFDPNMKVSIDPFIYIIGRHFKQPKEGLGYDNSPVAHMWRTLIFPDSPL